MNFLRKIKVAIIPKLGIFETNVTAEGNLEVIGGYESELLRMLLLYLGLPYELLVPEDVVWGVKKNGSFNGLTGMAARREVDIALGDIYLTEERAKATVASYPYAYNQLTFATTYPAEIHSPATFVYPFNTTLWISVILSILIFPLILKFCFFRNHSTEELLFEVLGSFLRQSMSLESSTFVKRLLILSWELFGLFLALCYSSVLLSFLTVPLKEAGIKDLRSLSNSVRSGRTKAFMTEGVSYYSTLMQTHKDPSVRLLVEYITRNSWYLKSEPVIVRNQVLNEGNVVIESDSHLRYLLGYGIFVSDDAVFTFPVTILTKKNSELTARINDFIHRITAAGIYKKNLKDYVFHKKNALNTEGEDEESTKNVILNLEKLQGAFIVLGFGLLIATFVFVLEFFRFKFEQSRKK